MSGSIAQFVNHIFLMLAFQTNKIYVSNAHRISDFIYTSPKYHVINLEAIKMRLYIMRKKGHEKKYDG